MDDCDNLSQLQPGEEAKLEKKTTETLPDEFSTLCRVASSIDCGSVNADMQEFEGEGQEKQQQHGEGEQLEKKKKMMMMMMKKKKKKKRGRIKAVHLRSFTTEEDAAYHKQVEETEECISIPWVNEYGFGVLDLPFEVITQDVVPCPPRGMDEVMLFRGMAKKAIGIYNNDNAEDGRAGVPLQNFQAHILYFRDETYVLFCRVEPKSIQIPLRKVVIRMKPNRETCQASALLSWPPIELFRYYHGGGAFEVIKLWEKLV